MLSALSQRARVVLLGVVGTVAAFFLFGGATGGNGSGDPRVHLGLGVIETIDELRIDWPDGLAETFATVGLDRYRTVERGRAGSGGGVLLKPAPAQLRSLCPTLYSTWAPLRTMLSTAVSVGPKL